MAKKSKIALNDKIFESEIIAENTTSTVHKLQSLTEYGFDGSSLTDIQKEFPDLKIKTEEQINNTFILIKNGKSILQYNC